MSMRSSDILETFRASIQITGTPEERYALQQSLALWRPYYRWLRPLSRGPYSPPGRERYALFVLCAQATLDGIAETFRCFFCLPWNRREVSHAYLIAIFPALCTTLQLTGKTEDVYAHACALHIRLQIARTGQQSGVRVHQSSDMLHDFVTALEQYLSALGTLCACNRTPRPLPSPASGPG